MHVCAFKIFLHFQLRYTMNSWEWKLQNSFPRLVWKTLLCMFYYSSNYFFWVSSEFIQKLLPKKSLFRPPHYRTFWCVDARYKGNPILFSLVLFSLQLSWHLSAPFAPSPRGKCAVWKANILETMLKFKTFQLVYLLSASFFKVNYSF